MKNVILVESPTKAKTLTKFLGGKYIIEASLGHIRDLPKGNFGIDIEHDFEPKYVIPSDKRKIIENLKNKVKDAEKIILATDPDREGEAISHHLYEVLKKYAKKDAAFERIAFHEITPQAIAEALENPRKIDNNLVAAQTARRVLDRIVGYQLSPLLWKKIKRKLSAGRVQSIALRLVVEREREIAEFTGSEFYRIFVVAKKQDNDSPIEFELTKINGELIEKQVPLKLYDGDYKYAKTSLDEKLSAEIEAELTSKNLTITDIIQKETKRSPYPPLTTSSLQQEASRRLSYPSRRTMSVAQRLYEEGFITYHRTDSLNLSKDFIDQARNFIEKEYGKDFLSEKTRTFQTKSKLAQEAHEAIRPTNVFQKEEEIAAKLGKEYANLYSLIYKRAISTQMSEAIFSSTRIEAKIENNLKYLFQANGNTLKFPGFLKMWYFEEKEQMLPVLTINETLNPVELKRTSHKTNPPPRYNEASLIGSMEKHGIGRPSTYAPIISTITARYYVEKQENRFVPTTIGTVVSNFLVKNFSDIDDIPFTATMEDEFDDIALGKLEWVPMIKKFYGPFEEQIKKAEGTERVTMEQEKTGKICPLDQGEIVVRHGKYGKFYACGNFPACTYKESIVEDAGVPCPKDGGMVVMKRTRTGRTFFGCANYPKCTFAVWTKEQLLKEVPIQPTATNTN